jgi:hypothetical protein
MRSPGKYPCIELVSIVVGTMALLAVYMTVLASYIFAYQWSLASTPKSWPRRGRHIRALWRFKRSVSWHATVNSEIYEVFISYSRADGRHAVELDSALRGNGLRPFFDRRGLVAGRPWLRELEQVINTAKAAIVLTGPRGLGNTQQYERELALIRQAKDPAFPVVPA